MSPLLLLAAFLGVAASAAEPPVRPQAAEPGFWARTYPVREYGAFWSLRLEAGDVAAARDKILSIMKKHKGVLPQPLETFPASAEPGYQQLSFRIERGRAQKALPALSASGRLTSLVQRDNRMPDMDKEIEIKLGRLKTEREIGRSSLDRLPSVAALTDEMIEHLEKVRASAASSADQVLFNVVIEAPPSK